MSDQDRNGLPFFSRMYKTVSKFSTLFVVLFNNRMKNTQLSIKKRKACTFFIWIARYSLPLIELTYFFTFPRHSVYMESDVYQERLKLHITDNISHLITGTHISGILLTFITFYKVNSLVKWICRDASKKFENKIVKPIIESSQFRRFPI